MVFEEAVFGGSVPKNFFPAVEKGLREASKSGMLAGYPMVGCWRDWSTDPITRSIPTICPSDGRRLAYKAGIPQAGRFCSSRSACSRSRSRDSMPEISWATSTGRGRVLGMNPMEDNITEVVAEGADE
jgi:elongation factor G